MEGEGKGRKQSRFLKSVDCCSFDGAVWERGNGNRDGIDIVLSQFSWWFINEFSGRDSCVRFSNFFFLLNRICLEIKWIFYDSLGDNLFNFNFKSEQWNFRIEGKIWWFHCFLSKLNSNLLIIKYIYIFCLIKLKIREYSCKTWKSFCIKKFL